MWEEIRGSAVPSCWVDLKAAHAHAEGDADGSVADDLKGTWES